jgi:hypothetical protein
MLSIDDRGSRYWYLRPGVLHRENGPAAEYSNGIKAWLQNGQYHRLDGPAYEGPNGVYYYINGKNYTKEVYLIKIKEYK